jgi:hypothetical protein
MIVTNSCSISRTWQTVLKIKRKNPNPHPAAAWSKPCRKAECFCQWSIDWFFRGKNL